MQNISLLYFILKDERNNALNEESLLKIEAEKFLEMNCLHVCFMNSLLYFFLVVIHFKVSADRTRLMKKCIKHYFLKFPFSTFTLLQKIGNTLSNF